jgi:hypothetical protein
MPGAGAGQPSALAHQSYAAQSGVVTQWLQQSFSVFV